MPVYECYCPDCHTIFSFFSRRVDTQTRPACPRCGRPNLERQVSLFAISKGRKESEGSGEGADADLPPGVDEERLMRAFASFEGDMGDLDDADPRQAARMMRRLFESTGLKLGDGMAEAMRRMEAGEDPDQIEAEMGDLLESEDPFAGVSGAGLGAPEALRRLRRELLPAARDDHWYPLRPGDSSPTPPDSPADDAEAR
ncbi:MAG: FmdB family zinc ribbon protein [Bdellovibrio bacteriovorus]